MFFFPAKTDRLKMPGLLSNSTRSASIAAAMSPLAVSAFVIAS
jgi:hypothetical protein